jgi:hypothetical protein
MTVAITRKELGAAELRREAGRCRDARAARRMLALALVLEGGSRAEAARAAGMDRQTLRDWDWVHRYNAEGLAGLSDRRRPGPRPRLSPEQEAEQEAELVTAVEQGPDPDRDGGPRPGRGGALAPGRPAGPDRGPLRGPAARALLGRQGPAPARLRPPVGPPQAPEGGRGGAGGVQKGFAELVREALPERARGKPVEIWFQDGWTRRVQPRRPAGHADPGLGAARRGTRPRAPRDRRYAWAYLFGAVCPERAVGAGLVLPYANTEATGLHLAEIGHHVTPGAHAVVVLDGAGWLAHGRRPRRPREPHPPAAAALQPRAEPGRERLGVPAPEQARPAGLARLRRDRRDLLRGLELARGGARPPRLDHPPRVGQSGQQLGPLV